MNIDLFASSGDVAEVARRLRQVMEPHQIAKLVTALEGAETQRQSGMEKKHEEWVLATLNFLNAMDIPFYNRDARGTRLPNDKEIPERLNLVTEKIAICARQERNAISEANEAKKEVRALKRQIEGYQNLLAGFVKDVLKVVPEIEEELRPPAAETTPPASPPPDRADSKSTPH